jgi:hypothetical protein|tara:strand:- start:207 stop:680 length:474 start_codon:yes stop_codon:yes gene_type:complete
MKKLSVILILLVSIGFGQVMIPDTSKMSMSEKMMWYQNEKKSPTLAVLLNMILPSLGHAYIDDWERGLIFQGGKLGGILLSLTFGQAVNKNWGEDESIGAIIFCSVIGTIWESIDVVKQTELRNKVLYKSIFGKEPSWKVNLVPKEKGIGLSLSYRF